LLFSVLAVLAGATSYKKIVAFIALQRDRLNAVFSAGFRRAPAVNTLRYLFLTLGPDDLEAAFRRHACDLSASSPPGTLRTVALDGKTLRGSFDHLTDRKAVDDRYGKGSLLITSQVPVGRWHEVIGDLTIGDAIVDRIVHRAHRRELKGASMRKKQPVSTASLTDATVE